MEGDRGMPFFPSFYFLTIMSFYPLVLMQAFLLEVFIVENSDFLLQKTGGLTLGLELRPAIISEESSS